MAAFRAGHGIPKSGCTMSDAMHGKLGDSTSRAVLVQITLATHRWKACDERISVVPRHGSNNQVERKLCPEPKNTSAQGRHLGFARFHMGRAANSSQTHIMNNLISLLCQSTWR